MEERKINKVSTLKTILNGHRFLHNPIPVMQDFFKDFEDNTFKINMGGTISSVITKDTEIIQYILQKNHKNYKKSFLQTEHLAEFLGQGLLTSNGPYWLKQRRLIQPGFHKKSLASFIKIMTEEILEYSNQLEQRIQSGEKELLMLNEMTKLSLQIVARTLFSQAVSDEEITEIGEKINYLQAEIVKTIRQPLFKWWRYLKGQKGKNRKIAEELYKIVIDIIEERRKSNEHYGDILDMLLGAKYEGTDEGMTNQQILDECLILFVAGYETTANALSWTFLLLDQNPEAQDLLLQEFEGVTIDPEDPIPSLMGLDYTRQVISESLRIYPPAWIVDRVAYEPDEFNGVEIKPGVIFNLFIYGVHHDPGLWPEPEKFIPSRFARENMKAHKPFSYFPFGGGPRLCIGNQFAMMEMQLVLFALLKKYRLRLKEGHPVEMMPQVTLRSRYGIKMISEER